MEPMPNPSEACLLDAAACGQALPRTDSVRARRRSWTALLAALLVWATVPGCLHQVHCCRDHPALTATGTPCDTLPAIDRGQIVADGEAVSGVLASPPAPGLLAYRALSAEQCRCLAARNAELANLLDAQRQGVSEEA